MRFGSCCWDCIYKYRCSWVCPWVKPAHDRPCPEDASCIWLPQQCSRFRAENRNTRVRKKRIGRPQYPMCQCSGKWTETKRWGELYVCPKCGRTVHRAVSYDEDEKWKWHAGHQKELAEYAEDGRDSEQSEGAEV